MESKYLIFNHIDDKPKTQVWEILSKPDEEDLGIVKWYAPWRQYCFFVGGYIFSIGCMKDIVQFLDIMKKGHRAKRIAEKIKNEEGKRL